MTIMSLITIMLAISIMAILAGICLVYFTRLLKGDSFGNSGGSSAEEARLIQELHRGLNRLDERIDALETILIQQTRARTEDEE